MMADHESASDSVSYYLETAENISSSPAENFRSIEATTVFYEPNVVSGHGSIRIGIRSGAT